MKTPLIKICGVTRVEDIALCEELNVDYIGLNFVSSSSRYVSPEEGKKLRSHIKRAVAVGVFADAPMDKVQEVANEIGLDYVQLHGEESVEDTEHITLPVIKAFRTIPPVTLLQQYLQAGDKIMLDGKSNGEQTNWEEVGMLPRMLRDQLFLAGGLTPDNVRKAIETTEPFAVDCASGVESSPGIKDVDLLTAFVSAVRYVL